MMIRTRKGEEQILSFLFYESIKLTKLGYDFKSSLSSSIVISVFSHSLSLNGS